MQTITIKNLQAVVDRLNRMTGSPMEYMTDKVINVDHYHLDGACGGYSLCRTMNNDGGVNDIFSQGHITKRALYDLLHAFIRGFEAGEAFAVSQITSGK